MESWLFWGKWNVHLTFHPNKYNDKKFFYFIEFHDGSVDNKALVLYVSSLYEKMKDMELPGADQVRHFLFYDFVTKLLNFTRQNFIVHKSEKLSLFSLVFYFTWLESHISIVSQLHKSTHSKGSTDRYLSFPLVLHPWCKYSYPDSRVLSFYLFLFFLIVALSLIFQSGSEIDDLLSQLSECEVDLNTLNSKEVPELYIIPENQAVLESKHKVYQIHF